MNSETINKISPYLIITTFVSIATFTAWSASHNIFNRLFPHQGETAEQASLTWKLFLSRSYDTDQLRSFEITGLITVLALFSYSLIKCYQLFRDGLI